MERFATQCVHAYLASFVKINMDRGGKIKSNRCPVTQWTNVMVVADNKDKETNMAPPLEHRSDGGGVVWRCRVQRGCVELDVGQANTRLP